MNEVRSDCTDTGGRIGHVRTDEAAQKVERQVMTTPVSEREVHDNNKPHRIFFKHY